MAARASDKGNREREPNRQELSFALVGLPSPASVTIDLSRAARSALAPVRSVPVVQIESGPGRGAAALTALWIQPQRIRFDLDAAPAVLTVTLQIACEGPFLFGWLHVPGETRSTVTTAVESLHTVGPGYWAVPVYEPAAPADGGYPGRAEEMQTIPYQRPAPPLGRDRVIEAAETAKSKDKPSS